MTNTKTTRRKECRLNSASRPVLILLALVSLAAGSDQQQGNSKGWPCARKIDPSYIMIAEESGGQVQLFQPSEASGSMTLLESQLAGNEETIYRTSGELNGEKESTIQVDVTIESITFSAFVQCMKNISIFDPSGVEFLSGTSNSKDSRFISGRIVTVKEPARGKWTIRTEGEGYFSVIAEAKTDLSMEAEFVELGGRPAHEGYFPIQRQPKMNTEEKLSITLDGKVTGAVLRILSREGELLKTQPLEQSYQDEDSTEYIVPVTIESETFRIQVNGVVENGDRFERFQSRLFHAKKEE